MRGLLLLLVLVRVAHADGFPTSGPCDDIAACEKACKTGKPAGSCYWGGVLAMQGTDEDRKTKGRDLFNRACAKGDAEGCYQTARIDASLAIDDASRAKVRGEYDKACTKGHARACLQVVQLLISGAGEQEIDAKTKKLATAAQGKAVKSFEQRCVKQKLASACDWAASLYGGTAFTKADPKKAEALHQRACQIRTKAPCPPPGPPPPPPGRPMTKQAVKPDPG